MIKSMDKRVAEFAEDILKKVEAKHPGFHLRPGLPFYKKKNCGCILGAICLAFGQTPDYSYIRKAAQALGITYDEAKALEVGFMGWDFYPTTTPQTAAQTDRINDLHDLGVAIREALARD